MFNRDGSVSMSIQTKKLAVLFADICGSTALYDNLGDDRARQLIAQCVGDLVAEVSKHHGKLIKTIGDEILCTFPDSEYAFYAACAMQRSVEQGKYQGDQKMSVRVGFHFGDVICEADDVFGDTVNVASRVMSITRAAQIMTTQAAVDNLKPALRGRLRQVMRAEFRGKQGKYDIFLVTWGLDDMLNTRVGSAAFRKPSPSNNQLVLKYRGRTVVSNNDRRSLLLGREKTCDIYIEGDFVSREHARIELHSDKFIIIDQSTNSTYIRTKDGDFFHINREEMTLQSSGTISLGSPYEDKPTELIEYSVIAGDA